MNNGIAIALAWPETLCKQAGAWYDLPMHHFGISKNGYYRVGHAAVVLIDDKNQQCKYFDFGRYHAPSGHGRVRSATTDHDLIINTKAIFAEYNKSIVNQDEIVTALHQNSSCHGTGVLYGAALRIDVQKALEFINMLMKKEFIPYGPFIPHGTNCSRFVRDVIDAGEPLLTQKLRLKFPLTFSPTPMWNIRAIGGDKFRVGQSLITRVYTD